MAYRNHVLDHNTVNHFRSHKLKSSFKDIFKQLVLMLADEKLISLKHINTDGTRMKPKPTGWKTNLVNWTSEPLF